uniref:uncharacterized protein LOC122604356 n=1 Tax=Erigeron canadensis TaxID=72917 RepID=UPI001CB98335|nr:uncharacterized protein LOC122604356 [Erigeron canadensis]
MLQLRPVIRQYLWFSAGNRLNTCSWHDNWCEDSPLYCKITSRQITAVGFYIQSKVADLIINNEWILSSDWTRLLPSLPNAPTLTNDEDTIHWRDRNGDKQVFSISVVWDDIRPRHNIVDWCDLVWFNHCIPKHAFILWLVFKERLKTQDMLLQWNVNPNIDLLCPFCKAQSDSQVHLFFDCSYSTQVWNRVVQKTGLPSRPSSWSLIIARTVYSKQDWEV